MKAIRFEQTGGPEVLQVVEVDTPTPGPGQVLIRNQAIGINFIETYQRGGLYPVKLPSGLGGEGAGVVEAVGEGVTRFKVGDPAAYSGGVTGSYAEYAVLPADRTVKPPPGIDARVAAASRWPTTRRARTPSRAPWAPWPGAACSSRSAMPRVRPRPSTPCA